MAERPSTAESSPILLQAVAYGALGLCAAGTANDVHSLLAQEQPNIQPKALVRPADLPPLSAAKRAQLIKDLSDEEFVTREAAEAELVRQTLDPETMRAILAAIDGEEQKLQESAEGKKPEVAGDYELLRRAKRVCAPGIERDIGKFRLRKDLKAHPWLSYLPNDAKLPPGLKAMIGTRDTFDTRLFFRQFPDVQGFTPPPGALHYDFTLGMMKFTEMFEYWGYRDALQGDTYADTMHMWAQELERIRQLWFAEETKERNAPRW